jgi:hypothetical protein
MADLYNHNILEACYPTIGLALGTQVGSQLDSASNPGLWVSGRDYFKTAVFVPTLGGTTADDLVFTVNQATSNTGTSSKVLACVTRWGMLQATTLGQTSNTGAYAVTTPTTPPVSTFTATGSAGKQSLIMFEIDASYCDAANGFYFYQAVISATADSAYGGMFYFNFTRHPQGGVAYPVNPLA